MILRVARHTDDLGRLVAFYTEALGFHVQGRFQDHAGYDGVFLGLPDSGWHLEFTKGPEPTTHRFDADDLLVFYPATMAEHHAVLERFERLGLQREIPRNPYWRSNGVLVRDPDGAGIVVSALRVRDRPD